MQCSRAKPTFLSPPCCFQVQALGVNPLVQELFATALLLLLLVCAILRPGAKLGSVFLVTSHKPVVV